MTSATVKGTKNVDYAEPRRVGMVWFAAIMLVIVGAFNLIDGIAAIAGSHVFVANAHYVLGNLRALGWFVMILGALQFLAGIGVMVGNQYARWSGVAFIGVNLIGQLFFIPAYPFWSLTIMAIDVFALYALCAYGSRDNMTA